MGRKGRSRDENQLAAEAASATTGLPVPTRVLDALRKRQAAKLIKNPAAVALGRLGGLKGGNARAAALSAKERSEIARKGAQTRWQAKREAEIMKYLQAGETTAQVAKRLNVTPEAIRAAKSKVLDALARAKEALSH